MWGDLQRYGPVHRHIRRELLRVVSALSVKTILDVGCGAGDNLAALAALDRYELTGTDISPEAIRIASQSVPSAQFTVLDIEREALPRQFDLVISMQVIEHLLDDVSALRHIARMARCLVFLSTMQGRMRPSEVSIGHVRNYSAAELRRKLECAGLAVAKMWGWGFPFYSPLFRTFREWVPDRLPTGSMGRFQLWVAGALYHLYRLNWPWCGDVLYVLARPAR